MMPGDQPFAERIGWIDYVKLGPLCMQHTYVHFRFAVITLAAADRV